MRKSSKNIILAIVGGVFTWEGVRNFVLGNTSGGLLVIIGILLIIASRFWE